MSSCWKTGLAVSIGLIFSGQSVAEIPTDSSQRDLLPGGAKAGGTYRSIAENPVPEYLMVDETGAYGNPSPELVPKNRAAIVSILGFRVVGSTVYSEKELLALLPAISGDTKLPLDRLYELANLISNYYHQGGYTSSYAFLPQQEVADGVITFEVLEGRVGKVTFKTQTSDSERINTDFYLARDKIKAYLDIFRSDKPGVPRQIREADLQRQLYLFNDLPGLRAEATMSSGSVRGVYDVELEVSDTDLIDLSLDFNNYGSSYNGEYRYGAVLNINNPMAVGDQITFRPLFTTGHETRYGSIAYSLPLGVGGFRLGLKYSNMESDIRGDFSQLGIRNEVQVYSVYGTYPFARSRDFNVIGSFSYDKTEINQTWGVATNTLFKDEYAVATASLVGTYKVPEVAGSLTTVTLAYRKVLEKPGDKTAEQNIEPQFGKTMFDLARVDRFGGAGEIGIYYRYAGQRAEGHLVNNEMYSLGGPGAIRGYPSGAGMGDNADLFSFEFRYDISAARGPGAIFNYFQVVPFIDYGASTMTNSNATTEAAATGVALRFGKINKGYEVDFTYANPYEVDKLTAPKETNFDSFWVKVVFNF